MPSGDTIGQLVLSGNFLLAVLVPVIAIFVTNQDCLGGWIYLWSPCSGAGTFDFMLDGMVGNVSFTYDVPCRFPFDDCDYSRAPYTQEQTKVVLIRVVATITRHEEICSPSYNANGGCPRCIDHIALRPHMRCRWLQGDDCIPWRPLC